MTARATPSPAIRRLAAALCVLALAGFATAQPWTAPEVSAVLAYALGGLPSPCAQMSSSAFNGSACFHVGMSTTRTRLDLNDTIRGFTDTTWLDPWQGDERVSSRVLRVLSPSGRMGTFLIFVERISPNGSVVWTVPL